MYVQSTSYIHLLSSCIIPFKGCLIKNKSCQGLISKVVQTDYIIAISHAANSFVPEF